MSLPQQSWELVASSWSSKEKDNQKQTSNILETKQSKKSIQILRKKSDNEINCCQRSQATLDLHIKLSENIHSLRKDEFADYSKRMGTKRWKMWSSFTRKLGAFDMY